MLLRGWESADILARDQVRRRNEPILNGMATPCKQGRRAGGKHPLILRLKRRPGTRGEGLLLVRGQAIRCAIGRSAIHAPKREGDGATPVGRLRLLALLYRADRGPPPATRLPVRAIRHDEGWCDAPFDPNYNRPIRLPYRQSHEVMRRDDTLYDMVVILDWNLTRRLRGRGSAIFLHIARPDFGPTAGCIALSPRDMRRLLQCLPRHAVIRIDG